MKHKTNKLTAGFLTALCLCAMLGGCAPLQQRIAEYSDGKEPCYLNAEDVTQFTYKGNRYTILNETVPNSRLGEWVGYIRQLVAVNEAGEILVQADIEAAAFQSLADLADSAPDAAYIIPYLNVYAAPDDASCLIVDANGSYHRAILSSECTEADTVFAFRTAAQTAGNAFTINPQDATQLLCDGAVYQVTTEKVSADQLGNCMDILAETVTFDADTRLPLTKKELTGIDWFGTDSDSHRERWFYMDVYEIEGISVNEAVAVKVNNQYYRAQKQ